MPDKLQIDFKTSTRSLTGDRGVFYEATNRAIIVLPNHESYDDILATIQHESIHFCLKDTDDLDDEHEESIIWKMAWAEYDLI
tara:strand:- start:1680 stop:1928 length:249 start_codon:yes stop_codon:yes gene_type:complete